MSTKSEGKRSKPGPFKHDHGACIACFHRNAHGVWDGYSLAMMVLFKAGYGEAAGVLDAKQNREVNRSVWRDGTGWHLNVGELRLLMQHHGDRAAGQRK